MSRMQADLEPVYDGLFCPVCAWTYPILSGIPDFIVVDLEESRNRSLRVVGTQDSRPLPDTMAASVAVCIMSPFSRSVAMISGTRCK